MKPNLDQIAAAALSLSPESRAQLAERLLASLDDDPDVTAAWIAEARRRDREIQDGSVQLVDAEDALARARAKLKG